MNYVRQRQQVWIIIDIEHLRIGDRRQTYMAIDKHTTLINNETTITKRNDVNVNISAIAACNNSQYIFLVYRKHSTNKNIASIMTNLID